ncbi:MULTISPECIES: thiol reductant ABC exporter subunit CydC [Hyphomicrobiales]|jgi:ATP-binding cassette subfamily C protein CydC|uniref:Thiol reductant ABC exporter subunit CydC n=3 Tax=Brucella TaxID=234 RepID=A0AB34DTI7_9HYPH|nr:MULTISPECIES: thiol reductant ABC exporter subunit CydC [Brucella]KAB2704452.1 thiol reductant ABC exporter subunit CydC [Brucella lupini]KAB2763230.1 thiol reductant ABC exporter subunit CydC [Brucella anthropi]WGG60861.1 thiol reductant ABC exporter subunit CydC [Brucella intermedia]
MSRLSSLRPVIALFWGGDRRMLVYGVLLSLSTALAGIALLGLSGWFIVATSIAGATSATALAFDVFMPSAGIRLLAIGRTASRYGERLTTHDATLRVLARLRETVFRGYAGARAARSLAANPSRMLFRLTIDIDALDSLYLRVIAPVMAAGIAAIFVAVALAFVRPLLGLAVGVALITGGLGIPFLVSRHAVTSSRRRAYALEVLRSRAIDLVRGQADLAMAGRLGAHLRAIEAADIRLGGADRALNRAEADAGFGLSVLSAMLLSGVLVATAFLAEAGTIGAAVAAFAVLLVLASLEPFGLLRRGAVEFGRTLQAAARLAPRLAPDAVQKNQPAMATGIAIRLDDVEIRHRGADLPVLSGVTLTIRAGERVALVGASGAGKSSFLSLLAGELTPVKGVVLACPLSMLTQRTELFRDTLRGNLAIARASATDEEMLEALRQAGLADHVASLSTGLDTMLGEGGAGLSAGQARRLALARLLLLDPPLWLLDEPSEALDGETARDLLARLHACARGRTVLIATHIRREADLADRILVMRNGHMVADIARGTTEFNAELSQLRPD